MIGLWLFSWWFISNIVWICVVADKLDLCFGRSKSRLFHFCNLFRLDTIAKRNIHCWHFTLFIVFKKMLSLYSICIKGRKTKICHFQFNTVLWKILYIAYYFIALLHFYIPYRLIIGKVSLQNKYKLLLIGILFKKFLIIFDQKSKTDNFVVHFYNRYLLQYYTLMVLNFDIFDTYLLYCLIV